MPRNVCKSLGKYVRTTVHAWVTTCHNCTCLQVTHPCAYAGVKWFVARQSSHALWSWPAQVCHASVQASTSAELKTIAFWSMTKFTLCCWSVFGFMFANNWCILSVESWLILMSFHVIEQTRQCPFNYLIKSKISPNLTLPIKPDINIANVSWSQQLSFSICGLSWKLPGEIGFQKLTILWRCRILPVQHLTLPLTSTWKASGSPLASE